MKTLVLLLSLSSVAVACGTGCTEWEGNCACDAPSTKVVEVNLASDEKPRKEPQHEWETGDVKADMPQSLIASDAKLDAERMSADEAGKRAAGLK